MGVYDMFVKKCKLGHFKTKDQAQETLNLTKEFAIGIPEEVFQKMQKFIDEYFI
jgi:hypothetical protein